MKILLLFIFTILLSCSNNNTGNKSIKIDINDNLTFEEFKENVIKYGKISDFPKLD